MVSIGDQKISGDDFYKVLINNLELNLDEEALRKVFRSHYFLKEFTREKLIYGINTGFGPMAQYRINHDDQMKLQYNLIRSHCSGSGNPIPEIDCKAVMLARLNTLMQGFAGIHPDALVLIKDLINKELVLFSISDNIGNSRRIYRIFTNFFYWTSYFSKSIYNL